MSINKTARQLYDTMQGMSAKKDGYDTPAQVVRVEGSTAWVHIPGGVEETPVKMTMNAKKGDTVQVRVANGRAWIAGNATAPPTDDTRAIIADNTAKGAQSAALSAIGYAEEAGVAAAQAKASAESAAGAAQEAWEHAEDAYGSARDANTAANNALMGLGTVESVLDVINWFAEHKKASTDTTVDPTKSYYTYDPDTGILQRVQPEGDEDPSALGWYEIDEAIANYIGTHLALTDEGLNVVGAAQGWRVVIAAGGGTLFPNAGVYLVDPQGNIAQQTNANGVAFNTGRPVTIGDSTASIIFDGNGHINMIGANVTIGGANNVNGTLTILNASGNTIGSWDNSGIQINSTYGTFKAQGGALGLYADNANSYFNIFDTDSSAGTKLGVGYIEIYNPGPLPSAWLKSDGLTLYSRETPLNTWLKLQGNLNNTEDNPTITFRCSDVDSSTPGLIFDYVDPDYPSRVVYASLKYSYSNGQNVLTFAGIPSDGIFIAPNVRASNGTRSITLKTSGTVAGLYDDDKDNYLMYGSTDDTWIYLNRGDIYSSGVYCGTKVLRTDGTMRVGTGTAPYTNVNKGSIEVYGVSTSISYVGVYGDGAGSGSQIYLQCETDGRVTLGSRGRNGTWYTILNRANNEHEISAHGEWRFDNSKWIYFNNSSGARKGMLYMNSSNQFFCGYAGYAESFGASYFDGNVVYIRSKNNIECEGNFLFQDYTNTKRRPVASVSGDGSRVAYMQVDNNTRLAAFTQNGTAGSSISKRYWTVSTSDIRLKENIEDTAITALPIINDIKMRAFDWKDTNDHWDIGMIADEVEQVDSRLVYGGGYTEDGYMDTKSIDTFYLMGYLIKAVQELSAEIEALKGKAS